MRVQLISGVENGPQLMLHGGAWDIPEVHARDHERALEAVLAKGAHALREGASAEEVVVQCVMALEADGTFDAGRGSVLNAEGFVELDAGLMRDDGAYAGVMGLCETLHAIEVAHRLLHTPIEARLLAGPPADAFARSCGIAAVDPAALIHPREAERYRALCAEHGFAPSHAFMPKHPSGTVGAVARDGAGRLAAATSTGGTPLKPVGRVGDSPLPGGGYFASALGAASCTGWGEAIAGYATAVRTVDALAHLPPDEAVLMHLYTLSRSYTNARGDAAAAGIIVLDALGHGAWGFTTPRMARAWWSEAGSGVACTF